MNSATLRFIPKEDLEMEGYGEYVKLFSRKRVSLNALKPKFETLPGALARSD
jgi:hypothetical protein